MSDIERTKPLPQKLGELVKVLQRMLDNGTSPDTVVSVFDADLRSYQPVSLASYGDGYMTLHYDDDYDDEIPRWQKEIRSLLISECGQDVDGSGCDSGDPLDLTLTEIGLAFNVVKESQEPANPGPSHVSNTIHMEFPAECLRKIEAMCSDIRAQVESFTSRSASCERTKIDSPGADAIAADRSRQFTEEGYGPEHDDQHKKGQLALAAAAYAIYAAHGGAISVYWPFDEQLCKPTDNHMESLAKAGAFIAAEYDRLTRMEVNNELLDKDFRNTSKN